MRSDTWNDAREQIMQGAVRLTQGVNDAEARSKRAEDAGAALAAEVYAYLGAPEDVGRGALREAHDAYMALHAGNFTALSPDGPSA